MKKKKKASTGTSLRRLKKNMSFKEKLQEIVQQFRSKKTNSALQASYFFFKKKNNRRTRGNNHAAKLVCEALVELLINWKFYLKLTN